jgi:hypothetical protein
VNAGSLSKTTSSTNERTAATRAQAQIGDAAVDVPGWRWCCSGGGGDGGGGGLTIGVRNDEEWILVLRERWWTADEARGWIRRTGAGEGRASLLANKISIR